MTYFEDIREKSRANPLAGEVIEACETGEGTDEGSVGRRPHPAHLWVRAHAHLADPYPSDTVPFLVEAFRSRREPGNGIAFIPVHGEVRGGDASEGNMSLFL